MSILQRYYTDPNNDITFGGTIELDFSISSVPDDFQEPPDQGVTADENVGSLAAMVMPWKINPSDPGVITILYPSFLDPKIESRVRYRISDVRTILDVIGAIVTFYKSNMESTLPGQDISSIRSRLPQWSQPNIPVGSFLGGKVMFGGFAEISPGVYTPLLEPMN